MSLKTPTRNLDSKNISSIIYLVTTQHVQLQW